MIRHQMPKPTLLGQKEDKVSNEVEIMKQISKKQQKELRLRRQIRFEHLEEQLHKYGYTFCMTCKGQPDFRGFELCHKISLAQGGKTTKKNTYIKCGFCHSKDHGIREVSK